MQGKIAELRLAALQSVQEAASVQELRDARIRFLGKKGELTQLLRSMGSLSAEERPVFGKMVNEVRDELEAIWDNAKLNISAGRTASQAGH